MLTFTKCKKFFLVFTILVFIFSSVDYGIFVKASGLLDNHIKIEKKEKNPRNGKVLYEVKSERSSYEKVFRKDDGSYEVVTYQEPVHYLENGNWEEIDNSIIEDNSGDYTNKRNSVKIKMPKKLDDNKKITLKYHNQKLEFSVLGINKSESEIVSLNNDTADIYIKRNNNSIVRYKNVLDNVDIEYIIQGESLKEYIILNEYKENFSLSFIIDAYGLEAIQTEAGNIEFIKDNQIVYIIDKMFMTDVLGNYSDKVSMTIEKNAKDKYIFTVKPDDKWLKTAKYPVNIDPTYRLDYGKISDAYIRVNRENQEEGYINYGNSPLIKIGQDDSIIILMFGYIKFTVPSILNGKLMTYADLNLYVDNLSGCPTKGCRVNAYRIKSSWDESTINVYNSPDVDFSLVADYQFIKTAKSYVKFDITDTAKYWETYGGNNGIYLSIPNLNEFVDFASSEYGTASLRPVFHVGYIDTTGLEDYWTYQSQSLNQAGVGYVNTVSGDLTWVLPLYTNPTIRTPFNLSLIHNSNASMNNMGYGKGWRTSFNEKSHLMMMGMTVHIII